MGATLPAQLPGDTAMLAIVALHTEPFAGQLQRSFRRPFVTGSVSSVRAAVAVDTRASAKDRAFTAGLWRRGSGACETETKTERRLPSALASYACCKARFLLLRTTSSASKIRPFTGKERAGCTQSCRWTAPSWAAGLASWTSRAASAPETPSATRVLCPCARPGRGCTACSPPQSAGMRCRRSGGDVATSPPSLARTSILHRVPQARTAATSPALQVARCVSGWRRPDLRDRRGPQGRRA